MNPKPEVISSSPKRRIAVTGSSGCLGTILLEQLSRRSDVEVFRLSGDICDRHVVDAWVEDCQPDSVIHLAARVAVDLVSEKPFLAWRTNVEGTTHLLASLQKLEKKPWFFYASSSHVYSSSQQPIGETGATSPMNFYGQTKLAGEIATESCAKESGLPICIGRIFSFYHHSQVPPFLYANFRERLKTLNLSQPIPLQGANSVRDFLNAEEVVRLVLALEERQYQGTLNIASGRAVRIQDFLREQFGSQLEFLPQDDRTDALVSDPALLDSLKL
jgi:nucleoside-diphosphate-sugar epimerase